MFRVSPIFWGDCFRWLWQSLNFWERILIREFARGSRKLKNVFAFFAQAATISHGKAGVDWSWEQPGLINILEHNYWSIVWYSVVNTLGITKHPLSRWSWDIDWCAKAPSFKIQYIMFSRWWFQILFSPLLGEESHFTSIFFNWVETTN